MSTIRSDFIPVPPPENRRPLLQFRIISMLMMMTVTAAIIIVVRTLWDSDLNAPRMERLANEERRANRQHSVERMRLLPITIGRWRGADLTDPIEGLYDLKNPISQVQEQSDYALHVLIDIFGRQRRQTDGLARTYQHEVTGEQATLWLIGGKQTSGMGGANLLFTNRWRIQKGSSTVAFRMPDDQLATLRTSAYVLKPNYGLPKQVFCVSSYSHDGKEWSSPESVCSHFIAADRLYGLHVTDERNDQAAIRFAREVIPAVRKLISQ